MDVDLESKLCGSDQGLKRSDLERVAGEVVSGSDTKRPREGDHDGAIGVSMDCGEVEMEEDEYGDEVVRRCWEIHQKNWRGMMADVDATWSFDAETTYGPMRFTDGPMLPTSAGPCDTMQVYFIKVTEIKAGLQWPLDVYGDVAVRDSLDHRRNYLFRRGRNECQTLSSPQDSLLELTGPSRAILLWDEPVFEINLRVKGKGNLSEDDILCLEVTGYPNRSYRGKVSYARTEVLSCKRSTVEVRFAHLKRSVEATVTARIIKGSGDLSARLTACIESIGGGDDVVVLLDSRGHKVSVSEDGTVALLRRVVVVEEQGQLNLGLKAVQLGDTPEGGSTHFENVIKFPARSAHRTERNIQIGSSRLQLLVAWSYLP